MKLKQASLTRGVMAMAMTMALIACGGGGGDSGSDNLAPASPSTQTTASALYVGPISGFGSVIVNGMRFESVGAELIDDEAHAMNLDQLKLGMTLRVTGYTDDTTSQGTASRLELVHGNRGQVTALDASAGTLTLLGQSVITNSATAYQGITGLADLALGQHVEVYGALQADGRTLATLIELKTALASINLNGIVQNMNGTTFQVGTLTVNYSTATVVGTLANGKRVKVKTATGLVDNVLNASSVQAFDAGSVYGASVATGTRLKIKGVADTAPVDGLLNVSGTQVNVTQAVIKGGAAIAAGQFIEVKGNWDGSVLQASEVEMEGYRESQIGGRNELYGTVSSIDAGIAVVNGVTVDLNGDSKGVVFSHGSLAQIVVGSYVEIKGNLTDNLLQATKVELKSGSAASSASYEQYGQVTNFVSPASFWLNGVQVDASRARFEHGNASLVNGAYVEIKGSLNASGMFVATKVEIKGRSDD